MSTIVAVATGAEKHAGVGIVRISGDSALSIAEKLFCVRGESPKLDPNKMTLGTISAGGLTEQAFCVYFKAPLSYTGEDVVEFQCHGGKAVLAAVVALAVDAGAVPAERGEFTKRAFLNGKITLDGAEGALSMIEADSGAQLLQASRLLTGKLRQDIDRIAELLLKAAANLEAALDYPEEIEEDMRAETYALLQEAQLELTKTAKTAKLGRLVRDGATIAIVGKPNAGKSSLLNALIGEDRAIVTDIPGTTRDTLEGKLEIGGVAVTFVDTAGLRETEDTVEKLGVARAKRAAETADLVLHVVDMSEPNPFRGVVKDGKTLIVANKSDLKTTAENSGTADAYLSAKTGEGVAELLEKVADTLDLYSAENVSLITNERHRAAVECALRATASALSGYDNNTPDCIVVDIKTAYRALAEISGKDVSESVIDKIFASFCVGK